MQKFAAFVGPAVLTFGLFACADIEPEAGDEESTQSTEAPIINGVADNDGNAHNNVVFVSIGGFSGCSGTLVAPNLVLTAWHCVAPTITDGIGCDIFGNSTNGNHVAGDYSPGNLTIHTGFNPGNTAVASGVQILHPSGNNLCNNDIAFIVLNTNVGISPRAIRTSHNATKGELTTVVGYGQTESGFSGLRFRRSNVAVLSSGQDWNQISSAKEFVLGQSTCQGDSGGPVISASGAVIGVTSRGGDCFTQNQHFTSLNGHQALVNQAFAAASATPTLEGLNPPSPVAKLKNGEGPCTTGSDCEGFLCAGSGASSYCSALCPPICDNGTYCDGGFVNISGQAVEVEYCQAIPQDTACQQCRLSDCEAKTLLCMADAACLSVLECADGCSDETCAQNCNSSNNAKYDELLDCACASDTCSAECDTLCPGDPGGGGSGNAGGSGSGASNASGGSDSGSGGSNSGSGGSDSGGSSGGDDDGCTIRGGAGHGTSQSSGAAWLLGLGLGLGLVARRRRSR